MRAQDMLSYDKAIFSSC